VNAQKAVLSCGRTSRCSAVARGSAKLRSSRGRGRKSAVRRSAVSGGVSKRIQIAIAEQPGELHAAFGATRAGALLERIRLHLGTDRFLAERRRDAVWEAGCDYAALALARIESRMKPWMLAERVVSGGAAGQR